MTDSDGGLGITGVCGYAVDTTTGKLRAYSPPSSSSGRYSISELPPGTDRIAFQPCTSGPYPLTYSNPVTVKAGGTVTVNETSTES